MRPPTNRLLRMAAKQRNRKRYDRAFIGVSSKFGLGGIKESIMPKKISITCLLAALIFCMPNVGITDNEPADDTIAVVTDDAYKIGPGDSPEKYRALARYGAEYKAVVLAAKYLSHKGLLENYGKKQREIFCLAAKELKPAVIEKKLVDDGKTFYIKIKAKVSSIDFIRAEIKDLQLEKDERKFSLQDKMEQQVSSAIDPAQELSRAYRYIRKMQWRVAVIYLDHLEGKYPNWAEIYLAKAIAFYGMHETESMMEALKTSCSLGNREACEDIDGLAHSASKDVSLDTE
jgi:hypothetical protein